MEVGFLIWIEMRYRKKLELIRHNNFCYLFNTRFRLGKQKKEVSILFQIVLFYFVSYVKNKEKLLKRKIVVNHKCKIYMHFAEITFTKN